MELLEGDTLVCAKELYQNHWATGSVARAAGDRRICGVFLKARQCYCTREVGHEGPHIAHDLPLDCVPNGHVANIIIGWNIFPPELLMDGGL